MTARNARRQRIPAWLAPGIAAMAAFAWLIWPGADPWVVLFNMDVLYHVHRIARCAADLPWVSSVDTYSHAGAPWHLHWPGAHALPYAILVRIAGVPSSDVLSVTRVVGWVPPILGAVAAAAAVRLARRFGLGDGFALAAGLACAVSGDAVVAFHHGAVDHHAVTAAVLPLAAVAWLDRSRLAWTVSCFVLLATTPEATPYVTLFLLVAAACDGFRAASGSEPPAGRQAGPTLVLYLAPAAAAALALALDRALDPQRGRLLELSPFRLSPFQVAWLLVLGAAGAALAVLPRRGRTPAERWTILGGIGAGGLSSLLLGLLALGWLEEIVTRLGRVDRQQVGEELSLLRFLVAAPDSHWGAWAVLLLLVVAAALARVLSILPRELATTDLLTSVLSLGAGSLALLELRHARALSAFVAVALVVALADAWRGLSAGSGRLGRAWRTLLATWLALLIVPPLAWHALALRQTLRTAVSWPQTIGALCAWARDNLPDAGPPDAPPPRAVLGPWEWGHHLNVLGRQPVVVDGFNHEEQANQASWDAWLAETGDDLARAAERRGARHLVVTQAAGSIVGLLQRTEYEVVRRDPAAPGGALWLPSLRRHAAFRFDEGGGIADPEGRLLPLWASPSTRPLAVLDGDVVRVTDVPAARLFEIVPGARLVGRRAPGEEMLIECRYRVGAEAAEVVVARRVTAGEAGDVALRVALPAPYESGPLVVIGPYRVVGSAGAIEVRVRLDEVRSGAEIAIPSPGPGGAGPG